MYADFGYYQDTFGGSRLERAEFARYANPASYAVDYATLNRSKKATGDKLTAVKMAVCALAEILKEEESLTATAFSGEAIASETVGSWSRSYSIHTPSASDKELLETRKAEVIQIYLGPAGLLKAVAK